MFKTFFRKFRKFILFLTVCATLMLLLLLFSNFMIHRQSRNFIFSDISQVPHCYTAIVPGSKVYSDSTPSDYLQDRLDAALELYHNGKISRFLLSGDHGRRNYDEVNSMKAYMPLSQ